MDFKNLSKDIPSNEDESRAFSLINFILSSFFNLIDTIRRVLFSIPMANEFQPLGRRASQTVFPRREAVIK